MGIKGFHTFKHLGLAGDGKKDGLFLHEFVLEEGTVQISQLLDCHQPVEVLGNVDATAIEVFAGYIGILYKEFQDAQPSLLTVDNVTTAFHEFGHALHGFLSQCHYETVSGTNVARDFVEMFSQFNENFAFVPEILSAYANDYRTGEPIPAELVEKIRKSLTFNQGFMAGETCAASILDMKWHELSSEQLAAFNWPDDIRAFEEKVCREMGLIDQIIPRYRTSYFNHIIASSYSAGYYSYLWSEVLAVDAWEKFKEDGIFNEATAKSFRQTFLERGGSEEPMTLYKQFRGAEPNPAALMRARGLE